MGVRVAVLLMVITGLTTAQVTQNDINYISSHLQLKVKVTDNLEFNGGKHKFLITMSNTGNQIIKGDNWAIYFYSFFMVEGDHLPRPGGYVVPGQGIKLNHIKGCLFSMSPTNTFKDVNPGESTQIEFFAANWAVSRSDVPPNWYVTAEGLQSKLLKSTALGTKFVEDFTTPRQWKRYRNDYYNPYTARDRYERYGTDTNVAGKLIIPTPKTMTVLGQEMVDIRTGSWKVQTGNQSEIKTVGQYLAGKLSMTLQISNVTERQTIHLYLDPRFTSSESYNLTVNKAEKRIVISAKQAAGIFYGVQSLVSLLSGHGDMKVPEVTISDEPRYEFRGMYVDLARNFHDKNDLMRLIDAMAAYKLNKLHLHLADDEGWRLEIPDLPELVEVASKRCHDLAEDECLVPQLGSGPDNTTSGSGFLSRNDYIAIVSYANSRFIQVIPEVDTPGHARAAIMAMERRYRKYKDIDLPMAEEYRLEDPSDTSNYFSVQMFTDNAINPCINSTYTFIAKVMDEIIAMHEEAGQRLTLYHYGGDEVPTGAWVNSSSCTQLLMSLPPSNDSKYLKNYFLNRTSELAHKRGLSLAGWEDGWMNGKGLPFQRDMFKNEDLVANAWDNVWEWDAAKRAYDLANNGYKVILSHATHLYFDHPYEPDPEERGLYWAPRFTDTLKTFGYVSSDIYINIDYRRSGEIITRAEVCGKDNSGCPPLQEPNNIVGIQGHLWSETVLSSDIFDYMIFPRLLALAERAWHAASWENIENAEDRKDKMILDWETFASSLGNKELARLDGMGIRYRVPPPGARVENGVVFPSITFPGLPVEYRSNSQSQWTLAPEDGIHFSDNDMIYLRAKSADGTRTSREVGVTKDPVLPAVTQSTINYIANNLDIKIDVIDNIEKVELCTLSLTLTNKGTTDIVASAWSIYLESVRLLEPEHYPYPNGFLFSDVGLRLYHVGGSLYRLVPVSTLFKPLLPNDKLSFMYKAKFWQVARTDIMPNFFVDGEGLVPKVIASTAGESLNFVGNFDTKQQWKRFDYDQYDPFLPRTRYIINDDVTDMGSAPKRIIPRPFQSQLSDSGVVITSDWVVVDNDIFKTEMDSLADIFNLTTVSARPSSKYVQYSRLSVSDVPDGLVQKDSYRLDINATSNIVTVSAIGNSGAFYAMKTLQKLLKFTNSGIEVPVGSVLDGPRFEYRGMHLDVGRNFHSKPEVLKFLDVMATYKLNKFHFHLTEDEGWRLEIPGLPELTTVGAHRCFDESEDRCILPQLGSGPDDTTSGSGFYSTVDYKEILEYAAKRHITVIPEFDMPGHARAAIKSMEARERMLSQTEPSTGSDFILTEKNDTSEYLSVQMFTDNAMNPCLDSTFKFTNHIITEVTKMHQDIQPLTMFHFGGDEVANGAWVNSSACQTFMKNRPDINDVADVKKYFAIRISEQAASRSIDIGAWEDGIMAPGNNPYRRASLPSNISVYGYAWDNVWEWGVADRAYKLANEGYKVVLAHATHLYFDHPYEPDPEERGYYWATRYTDTRKTFGYLPDNFYGNAEFQRSGQPLTPEQICGNQPECLKLEKPENVVGIQGHLWSETVRTDEQMDQMIFPRLLALAERAWHKASWENIEAKTDRNTARDADWNEFANEIGYEELSFLDSVGVRYRVPPPGGICQDGKLKVNVAFPGLVVEVSFNNGNTWTPVNGEMSVTTKAEFHLRTRSADSTRYSRVVTLSDKSTFTGGQAPLVYNPVTMILLGLVPWLRNP